jgi:LAGLIDADG DNA endonuclease family
LPCFTQLYNLFYINGVKAIPAEFIYDLLTPVALAHWICCDGSTQRSGLVLCTDSYTIQEVVLLMNVLIIKFRLECTLRYHGPNKTHPRIYIRQGSMPLLRSIVFPYMDPSMLNKIHAN